MTLFKIIVTYWYLIILGLVLLHLDVRLWLWRRDQPWLDDYNYFQLFKLWWKGKI